MLSILIPIYNFRIVDLVKNLHKQCDAEGMDYEILCYDDGSATEFQVANEPIVNFPYTKYKLLPQNLGRSKIRNLMAKEANYQNMMFLDCDSGIIESDFISSYLKVLDKRAIISGGRKYSETPPTDKRKYLHWLYGSTKESRSLLERQANPLKYFHSNNFIVERQAFLSVGFDESISSYGYEDLLFAQSAEAKGIAITHIDNPVEHLDLQTSSVFLEKTGIAIDNLISLLGRGLKVETNLLNAYTKLRSSFMTKPFIIYYKWRERKILENLNSDYPKLKNLDLYKMNYFLGRYNQKEPLRN